MKRTVTQTDRVLKHLRKFGSISPLAAWSSYGIMRLAAHIWELRQRGVAIKTEMVLVGWPGKYLARYSLGEKK